MVYTEVKEVKEWMNVERLSACSFFVPGLRSALLSLCSLSPALENLSLASEKFLFLGVSGQYVVSDPYHPHLCPQGQENM